MEEEVDVRNWSSLCKNAADPICLAMICPQRALEGTTPQDAIALPPKSGGMLREGLVAARFYTASVGSGLLSQHQDTPFRG